MFYVYEHWRLDKDQCFYVGKGNGHRAYSKKRNQHWKNIVAKLEREGSAWEVRIVESGLTEQEAFDLEIKRISFWENKVDLVNMTKGGEGGDTFSGRTHSKETKEKMSISQRGKSLSQKTKNKISLSLIGLKRTEESKSKQSLAMKNKPSPLKGRSQSKEHAEKSALSRTGKKRGKYIKHKECVYSSPEGREKQRQRAIEMWAKRKALIKTGM